MKCKQHHMDLRYNERHKSQHHTWISLARMYTYISRFVTINAQRFNSYTYQEFSIAHHQWRIIDNVRLNEYNRYNITDNSSDSNCHVCVCVSACMRISISFGFHFCVRVRLCVCVCFLAIFVGYAVSFVRSFVRSLVRTLICYYICMYVCVRVCSLA